MTWGEAGCWPAASRPWPSNAARTAPRTRHLKWSSPEIEKKRDEFTYLVWSNKTAASSQNSGLDIHTSALSSWLLQVNCTLCLKTLPARFADWVNQNSEQQNCEPRQKQPNHHIIAAAPHLLLLVLAELASSLQGPAEDWLYWTLHTQKQTGSPGEQ